MPWGKIVAAVMALCLGWVVLGRGPSASAGAAPSGPRIQIDLYRAQVQTLESLLYAEGSEAASDPSSLVAETQRLASIMKDSESRLSMTPLILDVSGYADFLVQLGSGGFDAAELDDARREWERVRANVFEEDAS